jgi:UMF1 family MFS transporter
MRSSNKQVISWALYDWANSAFSTTVLAGFFPVFFKEFWSIGSDPIHSSTQLALIHTVASLVIALLSPFLGILADKTGSGRRLLIIFAMLGVITTCALPLAGSGQWLFAAVLFGLAQLGFNGALVFYDSMIVSVSRGRSSDLVSTLGYALGYLGGGVQFALCVLMYHKPEWFGLASSTSAIQVAFVFTGIWWGLFSLPLIWSSAGETRAAGQKFSLQVVREGLSEIVSTIRQIRLYRPVVLMLLGYWLYIDGVNTVIKMAVDYGSAVGFGAQDLVLALLITQFVGFPSAIAFGWLGQRWGAKRGILAGIAVYFILILWAASMRQVWEFYAMAIGIGLVQGGVQALSRSYFASIIPPDRSAEFFGFFNLVGRFASILGPLLIAGTESLTHSHSLGISSVALLFAAGGALLWMVKPTQTAT